MRRTAHTDRQKVTTSVQKRRRLDPETPEHEETKNANKDDVHEVFDGTFENDESLGDDYFKKKDMKHILKMLNKNNDDKNFIFTSLVKSALFLAAAGEAATASHYTNIPWLHSQRRYEETQETTAQSSQHFPIMTPTSENSAQRQDEDKERASNSATSAQYELCDEAKSGEFQS